MAGATKKCNRPNDVAYRCSSILGCSVNAKKTLPSSSSSKERLDAKMTVFSNCSNFRGCFASIAATSRLRGSCFLLALSRERGLFLRLFSSFYFFFPTINLFVEIIFNCSFYTKLKIGNFLRAHKKISVSVIWHLGTSSNGYNLPIL